MIVAETERLALSRLTTEDADFILGLLNQPSFIRFIGDRGVRTLEDAEQYILKGPVDSYERNGFGLFKVSLKSGTPIGICGLLKRDYLESVDLGFAFLPGYWSMGYASESATAMIGYAERDLRLAKLVAIVQTDNNRSITLLTRLGFSFEKMFKIPGEELELKYYARTLDANGF